MGYVFVSAVLTHTCVNTSCVFDNVSVTQDSSVSAPAHLFRNSKQSHYEFKQEEATLALDWTT